eukprot:TRINITY_DN30050_c0_g1_i1.p1 TRINITY_DN30050_c0_g1~~TRINITY_DN30050_c0_g1_i1.p1  ORF type:complete len:406 (-),score=17.51 TRINITY_DN30050_c0_g1_i1:891-2108(-)
MGSHKQGRLVREARRGGAFPYPLSVVYCSKALTASVFLSLLALSDSLVISRQVSLHTQTASVFKTPGDPSTSQTRTLRFPLDMGYSDPISHGRRLQGRPLDDDHLRTSAANQEQTSAVFQTRESRTPETVYQSDNTAFTELNSDALSLSSSLSILPFSSCINSVQGRDLIADDHGRVCSRRDVNFQTGCCPAIPDNSPFSCTTCNLAAKCCLIYEDCVACCLNPAHTTPSLVLDLPRAKQSSAIKFASVFEFCQNRCRHNSDSVVHENAYKTDAHHCFAVPPPPEENPEENDSLEGLTIVVGEQGLSCDVVCAGMGGEGSVCKVGKLKALNKCSVLQKYFPCRGECVASAGTDQPAEVVAAAPRHMHPLACLYNTVPDYFSCLGGHAYTRRLCPCSPKPPTTAAT